MEELQKAAELLRAGRSNEARGILASYLKQNPASDNGWYLLSLALTDPQQQRDCLQRVLKINPAHSLAKARLDKLTSAQPTPVPSTEPPPPPKTGPTDWTSAYRETPVSPSPAAAEPAEPVIPPPPPVYRPEPTDWAAAFRETPAPMRPEATVPAEPAIPTSPTKTEPPAWIADFRESVSPPIAPREQRPLSIPDNRLTSASIDELRPTSSTPIKAAARSTRKSKSRSPVLPVLIGLFGFILLLVCAGGSYMAWSTFFQGTPTPAPINYRSTPTSFPTFPPSRTPTLTFTPIPTRTITPTPTITPLPTLGLPGPTAAANMALIEQQVINIRGLELLTEVPKYVTTHPRFDQEMLTDVVTGQYLAELKNQELTYKAFGFLEPDFNLTAYALHNMSAGALGLYVPWKDQIFVFGLRFGGVEELTYAHEFNHALVDQHYPMDTQLGLYPTCQWDSQHCEAITALVEGDAELLMYLWWMEYSSETDWRDYWFYVPAASLPSGQKTPPVFGPQAIFPYTFGYNFAQYLYDNGGWDAINRAYGNPPLSTEQIMHPSKYLAGERPYPVSDPSLLDALGEGWLPIADDSLGEFTTFLLLRYGTNVAAQLEEDVAFQAAQGWGGDHYQVYFNPVVSDTVSAAHWIWDSSSDATQFRNALLDYQEMRFSGSVDSAAGVCRGYAQVSCVFSKGIETLWIVAPNQAFAEAALTKYTGFR